MAVPVAGFCERMIGKNLSRLIPVFQRQSVVVNNARKNHMFRHLGMGKEHDSEYLYEVSNDPKEWEFVKKLIPVKTVPEPTPKSSYPSGWRPVKEEAYQQPYFVERTPNHLLSVYLDNVDRGQIKITKIKRIHGDLWRLHNELKAHVEEQVKKKISSFVHEGNNVIYFKGDYVYYVEQWLLSKGF